MANHSQNFTHYALLIGINAYKDQSLKGCVEDVLEMKKLINKMPNSSNAHTRLLTATSSDDMASSRLIEEQDSLPTYRNVTNALKWISSHAQESNSVYVHYSGHGTAFRPPLASDPSRKYSNPSTGDLALSLLNDDGNGIQYLPGLELALTLANMVNRHLRVTLVLDCCFSGSIMRNDASVRYLEFDPKYDITHMPAPQSILGPEDGVPPSRYRNASLRPNWLINPEGYTVFTACWPTEVAQEIQVGERIHGVLSYFLIETFDSIGGLGGKQQHIYQSLRARFNKTRNQYQHNQTPMLYGNKDLDFFGQMNLRVGPSTILVTGNPRNGYKLEAGTAHGICEGDSYMVHAVRSTGSKESCVSSSTSPTNAEVIRVGTFSSDLKICLPSAMVGLVLIATALTRLSLQKFPIALMLGSSCPDGWPEALEEQRSLCVHTTSEDYARNELSFAVTKLDDASYEIRDGSNRRLLCLPPPPIECKEHALHVLDVLEHLASFELIKTLTNASIDPTSLFQESFRVRLLGPTGESFSPGCSYSGSFHPPCSHPECLIEVEDGASLQLEVTNRAEEGGPALCVHVYAMYSSWEIENILRGDYEVIPSKKLNVSTEFRKGTSGTWKKQLRMELPLAGEENQGYQSYCDDIIKVFLTTQPTSYLSLELPELREVLKQGKTSRSRGASTYWQLEDWAALSFRIRTHVKKTH